MKSGFQVLPEFVIVQHQSDRQILENIKRYFQCGYIKQNHGDRLAFTVRKQTDLVSIILPFFEKHKLKTKKRIDFEKFRQIVRIIERKEHLTNQGFADIQKIVQCMRKFYRSNDTQQRLTESVKSFEDKVQPLSETKFGSGPNNEN